MLTPRVCSKWRDDPCARKAMPSPSRSIGSASENIRREIPTRREPVKSFGRWSPRKSARGGTHVAIEEAGLLEVPASIRNAERLECDASKQSFSRKRWSRLRSIQTPARETRKTSHRPLTKPRKSDDPPSSCSSRANSNCPTNSTIGMVPLHPNLVKQGFQKLAGLINSQHAIYGISSRNFFLLYRSPAPLTVDPTVV